MRLNWLEKLAMNNPVRAAIQRGFEAKRLLAMGGRMSGGVALEIGCGRGVGVEIILERFGADRVDAFDLDPHMVTLALHRTRRWGKRVQVWTGDVTAVPALDNRYDAIFDFGIIHHVPLWRDALTEVHRVLKPGGRLYSEEVLDGFILHPLVRRLTDHPLDDRFNHDRFRDALAAAGFQVIASRQFLQSVAWFIADKPR
jgi:ubiquinone/menaquinone biosynthesis C-methylase UbiE